MGERRTTVKRARKTGRATPKGGWLKPKRIFDELALAQREVKRSRRRRTGETPKIGFHGKTARRAAGKRQRQARKIQRRLAKR